MRALAEVGRGQIPAEAVLALLDDTLVRQLVRLAERPETDCAGLVHLISSHVVSRVKQFDPFDRVLLTKGIDNQILTSFRTLNRSNNMISNTLKVVHRRFLPHGNGQGA